MTFWSSLSSARGWCARQHGRFAYVQGGVPQDTVPAKADPIVLTASTGEVFLRSAAGDAHHAGLLASLRLD